MKARFQQQEKVEVEGQKRNSLVWQGVSSKEGFDNFLALSSKTAEITSLEEIMHRGR